MRDLGPCDPGRINLADVQRSRTRPYQGCRAEIPSGSAGKVHAKCWIFGGCEAAVDSESRKERRSCARVTEQSFAPMWHQACSLSGGRLAQVKCNYRSRESNSSICLPPTTERCGRPWWRC